MKRLIISAAAVVTLFAFGAIANAGHDFTSNRVLDDLGRSTSPAIQFESQDDIFLAGNCRRGNYYRGGVGYYPPPRRSYYRGGGGFYGGPYHYHRPARRSFYYGGGYPVYPGRGFGISIGF